MSWEVQMLINSPTKDILFLLLFFRSRFLNLGKRVIPTIFFAFGFLEQAVFNYSFVSNSPCV